MFIKENFRPVSSPKKVKQLMTEALRVCSKIEEYQLKAALQPIIIRQELPMELYFASAASPVTHENTMRKEKTWFCP
jgi:hypothetical protein